MIGKYVALCGKGFYQTFFTKTQFQKELGPIFRTLNNCNTILTFLFYFQCGSKWPRIWFKHSGNPFAVATLPCKSPYNEGTTQN